MTDRGDATERLRAARLYVALEASAAHVAERALRGGVDLVQLRDKEATDELLLAAGRELRDLCRSHGALFLMNDSGIGEASGRIVKRPEIAAESDPRRRIEALYKLLFGRSPTPVEIEMGLGFLERAEAEPLDGIAGSSESSDPSAVYTQALLLSNEFLFVD